MAREDFREFLQSVEKKFFPSGRVRLLDPVSPPRWNRLGWKVGWLVEEANTGLQWWLADENQRRVLRSRLKERELPRVRSFSSWYGALLRRTSRSLGKPLRLDSVRWRKMDLRAVGGRESVQRRDWWCVKLSQPDGLQLALVLPDAFYRCFEPREAGGDIPPPWSFPELWEESSPGARRKLLEKIGTTEGLLNHLASLVLANRLPFSELEETLLLHPKNLLREKLQEKRSRLEKSGSAQRSRTLDKWCRQANHRLVHQVGQWLRDGALRGAMWRRAREAWDQYERRKLEDRFGRGAWGDFWRNLSSSDLRQIVPRLAFEALKTSLVDTHADVRDAVRDSLPSERRSELEEPAGDVSPLGVYQARQEIFRQGKQLLENMDYTPEGEWELGH